MGFGAPLDLSTILPAYRQYLAGDSTVGINFVDTRRPQPDLQDFEDVPAHLRNTSGRTVNDPFRIGWGPVGCSTVTDIELARPAFAWDVNRWYRALGIPFPYVGATSGALSRAYMAAGGQRSARLTYYLKRLLNKAVRALYDVHPLGETFLDDDYVQDVLKRRASIEASRRSEDGKYTTAVEVLDEWGFLLDPEAEHGPLSDLDGNDEDGIDTQDQAEDRDSRPESRPASLWAYSYWCWRSSAWSPESMEQWQALLVSALSARGAQRLLVVGVMGHQPAAYAIGESDGYQIVYLNEDVTPTAELAAKAADALLDIEKSSSPITRRISS